VTEVTEKPVAVIESHPCLVRVLPTTEESARRDFVLHAEGDENQLLQLAFMPSALGYRPGRRTR
jgi:hypothetical protein